MNLLDTILSAGGNSPDSGVVGALAKNFGLNSDQAGSALKSLLPMISRSLAKNTSSASGLESLLGALSSGSHARYLDDAAVLQSAEATNDGNAILGHLFGSKDVSRNTAAHAAAETGLDVGILKKMLPLVAATAMGALSKQTSKQGVLGSAIEQVSTGKSSLDASSMLMSFLDADKDGSVVDDVLNIAKRLF